MRVLTWYWWYLGFRKLAVCTLTSWARHILDAKRIHAYVRLYLPPLGDVDITMISVKM